MEARWKEETEVPYSRDPESFSRIFWDILDLAMESDQRIEIQGDGKKLLRKYYAFKDAWKAQVERAEKLGQLALAADRQQRVSALMRYQGEALPNKLILIHKDILSEMLGEKVTGSGKKVDDPLFEGAKLRAKIEHKQEILPAHSASENSEAPDNVALRIFGVDTSKPRERSNDIEMPLDNSQSVTDDNPQES